MDTNHQQIEAQKEQLKIVIASYDKAINDISALLPDLEKMDIASTDLGSCCSDVQETINYLSKQRQQLYSILNGL